MLKLSDYAKEKGMSYRTAYNHFKQGLIPEAFQLENGTIYIDNNFKEDEDIWINISDILKSRGYTIRKDDEQ